MQIFSRISILFTVFNQIRLKNYQIKTNKIFNFSHKISQKRHFVAQKWQFLCEINDIFTKNAAFFSNEWLSKTIIVKKYGVTFSPKPDSPAVYRGNDIRKNHVTAEAPAAVVPLEAWSPMTL